MKWRCTKLIFTQIINLALSIVFLSYPQLYLYWPFAANLLQHTLYRCKLSIDPFKVRADLANLKPAANTRNHDFGNLVFEEGYQLPTIFSHRLCYQHFIMKPCLEGINNPNAFRTFRNKVANN